MKCPAKDCAFETEDSDLYFGHIIEEKRKLFYETLGQRYEKLNIIRPSQFKQSVQEFVTQWTEANQEQAEGRFKRK